MANRDDLGEDMLMSQQPFPADGLSSVLPFFSLFLVSFLSSFIQLNRGVPFLSRLCWGAATTTALAAVTTWLQHPSFKPSYLVAPGNRGSVLHCAAWCGHESTNYQHPSRESRSHTPQFPLSRGPQCSQSPLSSVPQFPVRCPDEPLLAEH